MRSIDADALKRKAQKLSTEAWKTNRVAKVSTILNQFIDWIEGMPTIDAIEVVRCKDCTFYEKILSVQGFCHSHKSIVYANDFCSYGERRKDGEEE